MPVSAVLRFSKAVLFLMATIFPRNLPFLQLRTGATLLNLSAESSAKLRGTPTALQAELAQGTLIFSTANPSAVGVAALGAQLLPATEAPTVAQIQIVGPRALRIS